MIMGESAIGSPRCNPYIYDSLQLPAAGVFNYEQSYAIADTNGHGSGAVHRPSIGNGRFWRGEGGIVAGSGKQRPKFLRYVADDNEVRPASWRAWTLCTTGADRAAALRRPLYGPACRRAVLDKPHPGPAAADHRRLRPLYRRDLRLSLRPLFGRTPAGAGRSALQLRHARADPDHQVGRQAGHHQLSDAPKRRQMADRRHLSRRDDQPAGGAALRIFLDPAQSRRRGVDSRAQSQGRSADQTLLRPPSAQGARTPPPQPETSDRLAAQRRKRPAGSRLARRPAFIGTDRRKQASYRITPHRAILDRSIRAPAPAMPAPVPAAAANAHAAIRAPP